MLQNPTLMFGQHSQAGHHSHFGWSRCSWSISVHALWQSNMAPKKNPPFVDIQWNFTECVACFFALTTPPFFFVYLPMIFRSVRMLFLILPWFPCGCPIRVVCPRSRTTQQRKRWPLDARWTATASGGAKSRGGTFSAGAGVRELGEGAGWVGQDDLDEGDDRCCCVFFFGCRFWALSCCFVFGLVEFVM